MKKKRRLTGEQEDGRIQGLRLLARIIARHYLEHPELYPAPSRKRADGGFRASSARTNPNVNAAVQASGGDAGPKGGKPMKQKRIIYRVRLKAEAVWELLNRLNLTQNELARRIGRSSGYLSQLINGDRFPSGETRQRLMDVLGVSDFDVLFVQERVDA